MLSERSVLSLWLMKQTKFYSSVFIVVHLFCLALYSDFLLFTGPFKVLYNCSITDYILYLMVQLIMSYSGELCRSWFQRTVHTDRIAVYCVSHYTSEIWMYTHNRKIIALTTLRKANNFQGWSTCSCNQDYLYVMLSAVNAYSTDLGSPRSCQFQSTFLCFLCCWP